MKISELPLLLAFIASTLIGQSFLFANCYPVSSTDTNDFMQEISIFLIRLEDNGKTGKRVGCGDSIIPIKRKIRVDMNPVMGALEELLQIREPFIDELNLYNSLSYSSLKVKSVVINEGKATIQLNGKFLIGGVCDHPRFKAQILETVLQFPFIHEVSVFINGKSIDEVLSLKGR